MVSDLNGTGFRNHVLGICESLTCGLAFVGAQFSKQQGSIIGIAG